jgi:hypothetical protein
LPWSRGVPRCFQRVADGRLEERTLEQLFHVLPGLGRQRRVTRCTYVPKDGTALGELDGVVQLWIEETPELGSGESSAAGEAESCYDPIGGELVWRHLDGFEHRCEIRCHLPRGQHTDHGKVYRGAPPWAGLAQSLHAGFRSTGLAAIAADTGRGSGAVYREIRYAVIAVAAVVASTRRGGAAPGGLERGGLRRIRRVKRAQGAPLRERVLRPDRQTRALRHLGRGRGHVGRLRHGVRGAQRSTAAVRPRYAQGPS